MGGVVVRKPIYEAFMRGPEHAIELFHGYTYSAHPLACAAGLAALDLYREEGLFERARKLEPAWYDAAMGLRGLPGVLDIRCVGPPAPIARASRRDGGGRRAYPARVRAFGDETRVTRIPGDPIAPPPPLIVSEADIDEIFTKVARVIKATA